MQWFCSRYFFHLLCSFSSTGSLCNSFVSQCYLLPIMDSIFVRKDHRGNGHGLQMLEDFVDSFKDDELGLKYPLTLAMQKGKISASLLCSFKCPFTSLKPYALQGRKNKIWMRATVLNFSKQMIPQCYCIEDLFLYLHKAILRFCLI